MKITLPIFALLSLLSTAAAAPKAHEETVFLFGNRQVTIAVPDGFGFNAAKEENGALAVKIADPKGKIFLQISFAPDPDGKFSTARARKEFLHDSFQDYVENSAEQAMQFEELEPRDGAGTYCVFTDAKLARQPKLPAGEHLHSTVGLKTWPGVMAVFTLLSNGTNSKEYAALMKLLRESIREKPASKTL